VRPLKLELKGFTAFREAAVLDLAGLEVFAISGLTGSGKSSLLDAMTYALYGRVERVGDRVSQLISQGLPRMAVSLEFEVGHDRYKVTRSTPAKGATKIQLMRWDADQWNQAGEGSDRVRDVERRLAGIIGLTYDGFTRSVLLPQGKFAEFMVGDPKKRREILTELLGHALFKRMAERAGSMGREAAIRAETLSGVLEQEFGDVTPEALAEAKRRAKDVAGRERALTLAAEQVIRILARWDQAKGSIEELKACATEAGNAATQAQASADELGGLAERLEAHAEAAAELAARAASADQALELARAALSSADATLGSATDLTKAHTSAHALAEMAKARAKVASEGERSKERALTLEGVLELCSRTLVEGEEALAVREAGARDAETALEAARHADSVTAVSAGLVAGDPCPVCGQPLPEAPGPQVDGALDAATRALEAARTELEAARKTSMEAQRALDRAKREAESNAAEQVRVGTELEELERSRTNQTAQLVAILGDPLPQDPAGEVERRMAERRRLDDAERNATREASEATQAALKAEHERTTLEAQIDRHRERLAADRQPLLDRAARALGKKKPPPKIPASPETEVALAPALQRRASLLAEAMAVLAERLQGEAAKRAALEPQLLAEAAAVVGDLVEPAPTLEALAESVNAACRAATADVATATHQAKDLAVRLDRKKQVHDDVKQFETRAGIFKALAQELRADRLIAFLQVEALQLLAAAGSERLAALSDGRYRLVCHDDEFSVVDTWNGDEERSVRTLSGGETFLASLALALALADQVRSLSVTDRARLDSLFLDEGFGTLDPESLSTVTDAIEQLGGDGRLVGVITHVKDLAEQFPRIEVTKSPSGSRLQLVP
jgi:DNA repair protein SbcC/Rad50